MPNYTFLNTKTKKEETHYLNLSQYDKFKKDHPHLVQQFNVAPGYIDPIHVGSTKSKKPDQGFRDILKQIKKNTNSRKNPSKINTF